MTSENTSHMPPDVCGLCTEIERVKLPEDDVVEFRVVRAKNPWEMSVQLMQWKRIIDGFHEELHHFYQSEASENYKIGNSRPGLQGLYVAALNPEGIWVRGLVSYFSTPDVLKVEFIDVGGDRRVHVSNVRYLHQDFSKFPQQHIPAKLGGLLPPRGAKAWSDKAVLFLREWLLKSGPCVNGFVIKKTRTAGSPIPRSEPLHLALIDTSSNDLPDGRILNDDFLTSKLAVADPKFRDIDGSLPWETAIKRSREIEREAEEQARAEERLKELNADWSERMQAWVSSSTNQRD